MKKQIETGASDFPFIASVWMEDEGGREVREGCLHHPVEAEEMERIECDTAQLQCTVLHTPCEEPLSNPSMCPLEGIDKGYAQRLSASRHPSHHAFQHLSSGGLIRHHPSPHPHNSLIICRSRCQGRAGIGIQCKAAA